MNLQLEASRTFQKLQDHFGFIIIEFNAGRCHGMSVDDVDRLGFIDDLVLYGQHHVHLHARLIGPATFAEWQQHNAFTGGEAYQRLAVYRKFVAE